jgi:Ribbon-helix-helix protein, copG family
MERLQIYLRKDELAALRKRAERSGRSVSELIRGAIRKVMPNPHSSGLVAICDGQPTRSSIAHDSIYDRPSPPRRSRGFAKPEI